MPLENLLPHLIHRNENQMTARFNRQARKYGVNAQAWRVLSALLAADDQKVGELAGNAAIELSTLSHLLTRMGSDGLVKRRRVGNDQRSVAVCLTPAGRALTEKVAPLAMEHERVALAGFDDDEARTLKALLRRVAENVEEQDNSPTQYDAPAPQFAS